MRFNRFVSLNRPMLSLEAHLGVTASPQAPFPTDFVTLPVSSKSPPLRLTFSRSRERACPGTATSTPPGPAFQTCSSNFTPMWAGYVGWAYRTSRPCASSCQPRALDGETQAQRISHVPTHARQHHIKRVMEAFEHSGHRQIQRRHQAFRRLYSSAHHSGPAYCNKTLYPPPEATPCGQ
ncbi:hypothetical protein B0G82_7909 [Paraburkholderia sp. BL17N1]|nr:hypothetical protein B0G82_7909 [Paraburkholderia sp. BL17N1]